jgi:hypothetical protein
MEHSRIATHPANKTGLEAASAFMPQRSAESGNLKKREKFLAFSGSFLIFSVKQS